MTGAEPAQVAVISGPNLASEIAECQPAATVACSDSGRAVALQRAEQRVLRPRSTNADVVGTEIGGRARTSSRLRAEWRRASGWVETPRPRSSPGPGDIIRLDESQRRDVGRSGRVGDLVANCTFTAFAQPIVWRTLRRGETLQSAARLVMSPSVTPCESVFALASSHDVEMPLTDAVHLAPS